MSWRKINQQSIFKLNTLTERHLYHAAHQRIKRSNDAHHMQSSTATSTRTRCVRYHTTWSLSNTNHQSRCIACCHASCHANAMRCIPSLSSITMYLSSLTIACHLSSYLIDVSHAIECVCVSCDRVRCHICLWWLMYWSLIWYCIVYNVCVMLLRVSWLHAMQ